jgi:hypothetical protein
VEKRSALDSSALPPALLKPAPRDVRVNASGGVMLFAAAALVGVGIWGGIELGRRADTAKRHLGLFETERIVTGGEVVRLRQRGGDDDRRITAHYGYAAGGRTLAGETALRRGERERYIVGSPVAVWYLASEPEASWLDGYAPRPQPSWPATAVPLACGVCAAALIATVRRQLNLLAYGRPAMATVTKVEKKRSDKGTFWRVHYEWTTMNGATRTGKYNHGRKQVPDVGGLIPVVYDRDNTFRHSKYPMLFVTVRSHAQDL